MNKLNESFFDVLRYTSFNRLHPLNVSVFFIVCLVVAIPTCGLPLYFISFKNVYQNELMSTLGNIFLTLFLLQILFTLIFISKSITVKFQKVQAIILVFFGLKLAVDPFYTFLFFCYDDGTPQFIINLGFYILLGGFVFFIFSVFRAIMRVKAGKFKNGGPGLLDFGNSKGYISYPIIYSGLVIGGYIPDILENFSLGNELGNLYFLFIISVTFFAILLVIPEFILIAYCKYRFPSFNYIPKEDII